MRDKISASCLTGICDDECNRQLLYWATNNQSGATEKEWLDLKARFNVESSFESKKLGEGTARCQSRENGVEWEVSPWEPGLPDEKEKTEELCESKSTSNSELGGSGVEKRRRDATGALAEARLPVEVVERIFAMIAFPHLLKVRSLSKEWYRKFSLPALGASSGAIGSSCKRDQRAKKERAMQLPCPGSFLSIVSSVSTNWSVYCPVIIGNEGLIGYDSLHKKWQRLFTYLQQLLGTDSDPWLVNSYGPLICGVSQSPGSEYDVTITNAITRSWRKLPARPTTRVPSLLNVLFDGPQGYKVFVVTEDPYEGPHDDCTGHHFIQFRRRVSVQVFDSVECQWTTSQSELPSATSFAWRSCSVSFNGNIYCLSGDDRNPIDHPLQVWVYNLQEKVWTEIDHPFGQLMNISSGTSVLLDLTRFRLFVCGDKVLVVLAMDPKVPFDHQVGSDTLFIYELDPETRIITEKSRGPPNTVLANSEHIASDGVNIYFCTLDLLICYPVVVYNIHSGEWHCLPPDFKTAGPLTNKRWADFAFQPGLNPFMVP